MSDAEQVPTDGPAKPSPAGMYDCYLGGTANTAADREAVERVMRAIPEIKQVAWANRGFLLRGDMARGGVRHSAVHRHRRRAPHAEAHS
jgi:S-adenosyl methyltransferase